MMSPDTFDKFRQPERGLFGDNEQAPARNRVSGASDLKDFTLCMHRDDPKDKAVLLSEPGEEQTASWYARSRIEYRDTGKQVIGQRRNGQAVTLAVVEVTMPEWLAKQRGAAVMDVDTRMMLWFGGVWFGTKAIDSVWPPADPVFNAALAIMCALCCWAQHQEKSR